MAKAQLIKKEPSVKDYGENLYYVKVPESVSKEKEILVYADNYSISGNGDLYFYMRDNNEEIDFIETFVLASGNWKWCYQVHEIGQYPVSIHRWKGVCEIRTIEKESEKEVIVELPPNIELTSEEIEKAIMEETNNTKLKESDQND